MKMLSRIAMCLLLFVFLSSPFIELKASASPPKNDDVMEQVREKTRLLKHHLKANQKLERGIRKREQKIEQLLTELYDNDTITQQHIENNIKPSMRNIDNQVDRLAEIQKSIWDYINLANDNLDVKNYDGYMENIDSALEALEEREQMIIRLIADMDEFLEFLRSLQQK